MTEQPHEQSPGTVWVGEPVHDIGGGDGVTPIPFQPNILGFSPCAIPLTSISAFPFRFFPLLSLVFSLYHTLFKVLVIWDMKKTDLLNFSLLTLLQ